MSFKIERWNQPHTPNAAMLRHLLTVEGYRVLQWSERAGTSYGMHKHPENQSHWIISGALELTLQSGATYTLNAGDRDFLPAETYHSARVVGEDPVLYLIGEKIEQPKPEIKETKPPKRKRSSSKKIPKNNSD